MAEPVLLVMAAGMGSRYGGLKQIDPMTDEGEIILDFSLYDAMMAGFKKAVFVIRRENEEAFRRLIDGRSGSRLETAFVYQDMNDIPDGYAVPEGREKPWGTGHAILAARSAVDSPFCVINADDYYGATAFQTMYEFLSSLKEDGKDHYAMVGFRLPMTLTENGTVARGICEIDGSGHLLSVTERTKIMRRPDGAIAWTEDGQTWNPLGEDRLVSMNFWGFTPAMFREGWSRFPAFLDRALRENPLKGEYFLPDIVQAQIDAGTADVRVLRSNDRWYGVTYREDKETVKNALRSMKDKGYYPEKLWESVDPDRVEWV